MVAHHPVVLLGHGAVIAPQPGFDVHQRGPGGVGGQRAGQHRVGVSLHHHRPGRVVFEQAGQAGGRLADLDAPRLSPHLQEAGREGQVEGGEEGRRQVGVVVLAGVDHPGGGSQQPD